MSRTFGPRQACILFVFTVFPGCSGQPFPRQARESVASSCGKGSQRARDMPPGYVRRGHSLIRVDVPKVKVGVRQSEGETSGAGGGKEQFGLGQCDADKPRGLMGARDSLENGEITGSEGEESGSDIGEGADIPIASTWKHESFDALLLKELVDRNKRRQGEGNPAMVEKNNRVASGKAVAVAGFRTGVSSPLLKQKETAVDMPCRLGGDVLSGGKKMVNCGKSRAEEARKGNLDKEKRDVLSETSSIISGEWPVYVTSSEDESSELNDSRGDKSDREGNQASNQNEFYYSKRKANQLVRQPVHSDKKRPRECSANGNKSPEAANNTPGKGLVRMGSKVYRSQHTGRSRKLEMVAHKSMPPGADIKVGSLSMLMRYSRYSSKLGVELMPCK